MSTGYTCNIKDGISFKTFALNCARAFGACIDLRDEPGGGEIIPDRFVPSDYHLNEINEVQQKLDELNAMTPEEWDRCAAKDYDDAETERVMRFCEIKDFRVKYESMLKQVQEWIPPTEDHEALHQFMIDQITDSIQHDCSGYYDTPTVQRTGEEWAIKMRKNLEHQLNYHTQEYAEEVASAERKTAWVTALRESLNT